MHMRTDKEFIHLTLKNEDEPSYQPYLGGHYWTLSIPKLAGEGFDEQQLLHSLLNAPLMFDDLVMSGKIQKLHQIIKFSRSANANTVFATHFSKFMDMGNFLGHVLGNINSMLHNRIKMREQSEVLQAKKHVMDYEDGEKFDPLDMFINNLYVDVDDVPENDKVFQQKLSSFYKDLAEKYQLHEGEKHIKASTERLRLRKLSNVLKKTKSERFHQDIKLQKSRKQFHCLPREYEMLQDPVSEEAHKTKAQLREKLSVIKKEKTALVQLLRNKSKVDPSAEKKQEKKKASVVPSSSVIERAAQKARKPRVKVMVNVPEVKFKRVGDYLKESERTFSGEERYSFRFYGEDIDNENGRPVGSILWSTCADSAAPVFRMLDGEAASISGTGNFKLVEKLPPPSAAKKKMTPKEMLAAMKAGTWRPDM